MTQGSFIWFSFLKSRRIGKMSNVDTLWGNILVECSPTISKCGQLLEKDKKNPQKKKNAPWICSFQCLKYCWRISCCQHQTENTVPEVLSICYWDAPGHERSPWTNGHLRLPAGGLGHWCVSCPPSPGSAPPWITARWEMRPSREERSSGEMRKQIKHKMWWT